MPFFLEVVIFIRNSDFSHFSFQILLVVPARSSARWVLFYDFIYFYQGQLQRPNLWHESVFFTAR